MATGELEIISTVSCGRKARHGWVITRLRARETPNTARCEKNHTHFICHDVYFERCSPCRACRDIPVYATKSIVRLASPLQCADSTRQMNILIICIYTWTTLYPSKIECTTISMTRTTECTRPCRLLIFGKYSRWTGWHFPKCRR